MVIYVSDHVVQCFSATDGHVIRDLIAARFRTGVRVVVSMRGVSDIPSSFANGAFATLVNEFGYDFVVANLVVTDATSQVADMIRRCVGNAKRSQLVA